ncbi:cytochrome-c peroxidase [Endozoicomonas arenosclerae]|uniref:cytochrome-c peroxidase n=1 Tax=Endozoicomonas arenosclerae TaxID=1633495 RepID=UPI000784CB2C|nr:cytochrome c peroxidase [Endozoicomonas arenosclerae]
MNGLSPLFVCLGLLFSAMTDANDIEDAKYFSIMGLQSTPDDPSNAFQRDPDAIDLGRKLFFDRGMSASKEIACSTCHFTNNQYIANESIPAGSPRAFRSVMQITGVAYNRFFFWDGRADSLWAQALGPIQNPGEHNLDRLSAVQYVVRNYAAELNKISSTSAKYEGYLKRVKNWNESSNDDPPTTSINFLFSLMGKSLAAFQTSLPVQPSLWDNVARAKIKGTPLDKAQEKIWKGFRIFTGKARCSSCHDGPLFTDFSFHNTAMPTRPELGIEAGRYEVLPQIKSNEFGCYSLYSDASKDECRHLKYVNQSIDENFGSFKTPTLRNVRTKTHFGHASQFSSLQQMIDHYDTAPVGVHGRMLNTRTLSELKPIGLSSSEKESLLEFLKAL